MKLTIYRAAGKENAAANIYYPVSMTVSSKDDFLRMIAYDHVCSRFVHNRRSNEGFISADCLVMDNDNDHSDDPKDWITADYYSKLFPDVSYVVVPSRSNMKQKGNKTARPRHHIYFPIIPTTDRESYAALKQAILKHCPFLDENCADAARFIFGNLTRQILWHEGSRTVDKFIAAQSAVQPEKYSEQYLYDEAPPMEYYEAMLQEIGIADQSQECEVLTEPDDPHICRKVSPEEIIGEGERNSTLSRFAGRVLKRYGICDRAYSIFIEESKKCSPPLDNKELETIWRSACRFAKKVMEQDGYIPPEKYGSQIRTLKPADYSDIGQAKVIVREYGDELLYTAATDYMRYDGKYWVESKQRAVGAVEEFLDLQLEDARDEVENGKQALINAGVPEDIIVRGSKKDIQNLSKEQAKLFSDYCFALSYKSFVMKRRDMKYIVSAMQAAKPMLEMKPTDLDSDGMLLNTPDGTYDLRKGLDGRQEHNTADFITKMTAFAPSDEGKKEWLDTLELIFQGDSELIDYVQQIAGLCAIGNVYLEELIISYGVGSNGKSTFWNSVAGVLGSYSGNISADTLTIGCKRNVKPELAEAKGKRLLIAAELEEGMRLNTSTVKQLCSTDEIFAEKKYKDPFSFKPSHTLVLYTNHLPKVGAMDDGIWRRLIVIPFGAKITGKSDIKNYSEFLIISG